MRNCRIWALLRRQQKILADVVMEFPLPQGEAAWQDTIGTLAQALGQSRPLLLGKHLEQLQRFSRTAFLPADFIETVDFDKMEVEIFPEKKEQQKKEQRN